MAKSITSMAYLSPQDKKRHVELGSFIVDYNDVDVLLLENVSDIAPLYPLKPMTTLIAVCSKGRQRLTANNQHIEITEGKALICPPNIQVSGGEHSPDFECSVICIADHLVRGLLRDRIDVWQHAVYINQLNIFTMTPMGREEFKSYFALINSKLHRTNPPAPYDILLALLRALLLELSCMLECANGIHHEQKPSQGKVLFNRFLSLISNSQVKRQPVTVYASHLAITPKYLTMLCLKYSGKTASEWVAQYTVEEIRFFLRSSHLSIKEISARMGFSNMSHFGSYVRKHLGVSPSEYRYNKDL